MEKIPMKRITVLITDKNNEKIQKFRTDFIDETKENMSYAEALNWLLNFGASRWFREDMKDFRKEFYNSWGKSSQHKRYEEEIDSFDLYEFITRKRENNES